MTTEDVIAGWNLGEKTRGRLRAAVDVKTDKMPLASVGLNLALNGGIGYGRQTLFWGNKSAGKTSGILEAIGREQKKGKTAAFIDVEGTFDSDWAAKLGVDINNLQISDAKTTNAVTEDIIDLEKSNCDIIVVDSITALLPISFLSDGEELKSLEDSQKIASLSADLSKAAPMWNYANENTALILISQQNNKFGSMYAEVIPSGGERIKFMSTTIIKLFSTVAKTEQKKAQIYSGDKIFTLDVGRPVNWNVQNNKLGPQNRSGDYDFYYYGDHIGIDNCAEILDLCEKFDLISKGGGGNYTILDNKIKGRDNAVSFLRESPEIMKNLEANLFDSYQ